MSFVYKLALFLFLYSFTRVEGDQNSTIFKPYPNACQKMPVKKIVSSLSCFVEIQTALSGYLNASKTLAVLLDYDGTLAPLVPNPNNTAMPEELSKTVKKLAVHPKIFMAVISGRGLADVKNTVGIPGITYAGNHGIEIEFPDGSRHDYQLPEPVQEAYKNLVDELNEKLSKHNAWIEDKKFSLTFHYRGTPTEIVENIKAQAIQIIEKHGFRANQAHEAIEAKPPVNWNKGEAACYILKKKFGENFYDGISIVFVGDDTTDEDAMRALQGVGKTFRISNNEELETFADYRLTEQAVVTDLMKWVANTYNS